jgi:hypothetical protein
LSLALPSATAGRVSYAEYHKGTTDNNAP